MKKLFPLFALALFITSCNVTETIVFDESMSGNYLTGFDMSPMMEYANANRPASVDREKQEKMDTTIVFNEIFENYKDSIATLPLEEQQRLEKLKGMVLDMEIDEEKGIFKFDMAKDFKGIDELKSIYEQLDETMNYVKDMSNEDGQAPQEQVDELTKTEEVSYSFENNTFSRFIPTTLTSDDIENAVSEEMEDEEDGGMKDIFMMQFEEMFANSYYTLIYTFPKKIKSVSSSDAIISEDGKTVTYKVPWNSINENASIMNLDVVLED